jgi:hypothetical protein
MDANGKDDSPMRKSDGLVLDGKYWFPTANRDFQMCIQMGRTGPACMFVWLFLLSLANKNRSLAVVASSRFVERCTCLSRPTVRNALKQLCAAGMMREINQEGRVSGKYELPKKFMLNPSAGFEDCSRSKSGKIRHAKTSPNITIPSLKEGNSNKTKGGAVCVSGDGLRPSGHTAAMEESDADKAERLGMI